MTHRFARHGSLRTVLAAGALASLALAALPVRQDQDAAVPADHADDMAAGLELFKSEVRDVLLRRCLECHGGEAVEGDLDLSTREGLLRGGHGGPAVESGNARDSLLRILVAHEEEPHMPHERDALAAAEVAAIGRWIELGAPYDQPLVEGREGGFAGLVVTDADRAHWAFRPLARPSPPRVFDGGWGRSPIDAFWFEALVERGLTPNPPADRRTLIRRVTLDLIGVPPTPEEIEAFVSDEDPEAYKKLVDRLLDDPRYGTRWARRWLDLARWAESHGFEHDYDRPHAYTYRDAVVQAFNDDLSFQRFVQWQLAGDELAPENPLAMGLTGFLAAGVHSTQITKSQVEKERYDELDDMLATTGTAMLGLTVGCARCHDHKYDAIPTRDYYRALSTFTTTVRSEVDVELDPAGYREAHSSWQLVQRELAAARERIETALVAPDLEAWIERRGWREMWPGWLVALPDERVSAGGAEFTVRDDGSLLASGPNADFDTYTFTLRTELVGLGSLRVETLADPSLPHGRVGRADNGNIALSDLSVTAAPLDGSAAPVPVELVDARATFEQQGLPVAAAIDDDPKSAWALDPEYGRDHAAAFRFARPVGWKGGTELVVTLSFANNTRHAIGRPRLSLSVLLGEVALDAETMPLESYEAARVLALEHRDFTDDDRAALLVWYRTRHPAWAEMDRVLRQHVADEPKPRTQRMLVATEGRPAVRLHTQGGDFLEVTHLLSRGDPDQKVEVVEQGFLQVLTRHPDGAAHWREEPPEGWATSYRRRALASWITDVQDGAGGLLARVAANRQWQHLVGRGLVATPSDFGRRADVPTHPELLDYLATELIRNYWSLKSLHWAIVTSATYMQSSAGDAADAERDPGNVYGWRHRERRMEAEVLRDSMLSVAGVLDLTPGGPGTLDPGMRRRSLYFTTKRSRPVPMMELFDAPHGLATIPERATTTVAPQALHLMNDPHVRDWAEAFADRVAGEDAAFESAVRAAYALALGRAPSAAELERALAFLAAQEASYAGRPGDVDARRAALADFCQVLFCLDEFAYVD